MPVFRFLARQWVYVEGDDLEVATQNFKSTNLGILEAELKSGSIEGYEFHSVQTVETADGNLVDKPMRGGDIK